jgi:predicted small lipoprotein YifL
MARFLCVLIMAMLLSGCGQNGALYLPKHKQPIKQTPDNVLS